jgi:archaeal type IV pilus assembly protein PilA
MKKIWTSRKNEEAVSPVIATILMVAITVVLAAVLYVMVLGIGGGSTDTTIVTMTKTSNAVQYVYTVNSVSSKNPVLLTDVQVIVRNSTSITKLSCAVSDVSTGAALGAAAGVSFNDVGSGSALSAGDSFVLLKAAPGGYAIGSSITLTSADGTTTYASYTI